MANIVFLYLIYIGYVLKLSRSLYAVWHVHHILGYV